MSDIPIEHDCSIEMHYSPRHVSQPEIKSRKAESSANMEHGGDCGDNTEKPPLYFPQPEDQYSSKPDYSTELLDPWATGKVTCSLKGGITGLKPVADRYSITRYGPSEWRAHNLSIFQQSKEKMCDAQVTMKSVKQYVEETYKTANKVQLETTENLRNRANVVYHWKTELENAISAITEEMELLDAERRRIKRSLSVVSIPASIAGEFLQLRSCRLESDLVRDQVEQQLTEFRVSTILANMLENFQEIALCAKVQDLLNRNYQEIETQMSELKATKARMENDWSDKMHAYNIDSVCVSLSNDSPLLLWKAAATRFPADQSTPTSYDHLTQQVLVTGEAVRQRSINLRTTLKTIYDNSIKELRDQATCVDITLARNVILTQQCLQRLENKLLCCLRDLANIEKLIEQLRDSTKGLNNAIKLAQTRLDDRLHRRNVENCRDMAQFALIEEVKLLGERTSGMLAELKRAEKSQAGLVKIRGNLEHEISVKRKTLYIDKERGQLLRSFFPSVTNLSGF